MPVVPDWWNRSTQTLPPAACADAADVNAGAAATADEGAAPGLALAAAAAAAGGGWDWAVATGASVHKTKAHTSDGVVRMDRMGNPSRCFGKHPRRP